MHVFKIFIFGFKNVHPILDFLTRRGKFISYFSDFYLFFYELFSAELILKKNARAPTGTKAQPTARLAPLLSPHGRRAAVSAMDTGAAPLARPFPKPPEHPLPFIYPSTPLSLI